MYRIFLFLLLLPFVGEAQLQLAKIFSENMLFQRDSPVPVWGKAAPGKIVSVSFAGSTRSVRAKPDSSWIVYFKAQKANGQLQQLLVNAGDEKIALENILIGDIWVCIGQSNMEWPMMRELHFRGEIKRSYQPLLRFYNPSYAGKNIFGTLFTDSVIQRLTAEKFYEGRWQPCDSSTFQTMSAVAYYFGKEVMTETGIPIGLINLSIGGAPIETFIAETVLEKSKIFSAKASGDWLSNEALPVWIRERGRQNVGSLNHVLADELGKNHAYKPGFAYKSGIEPLFRMAIKGILCYQGESNAQEKERVKEYAALSKLMMDDYRKKWKQPQLPFYFVQLSSIDTVKYKGHLWPQFRDEQRKLLRLIPYCGMAVSSDAGARDDVHPTDKRTVGERLARWALHQTYKQPILPSGPLPVAAQYEKRSVLVTFQYMGKGLKTSDGGVLKGFSLDGITESEAVLTDRGVLVYTGSKPEFIYYGWKPFSDGNLVNSENLPASTFKIKVQ